jgi:hypothetical protein
VTTNDLSEKLKKTECGRHLSAGMESNQKQMVKNLKEKKINNGKN